MSFYENIELTDEELQAAILEGKKRKYFKEKNKAYWESQKRPAKKVIIKDEKELLK